MMPHLFHKNREVYDSINKCWNFWYSSVLSLWPAVPRAVENAKWKKWHKMETVISIFIENATVFPVVAIAMDLWAVLPRRSQDFANF